MDPPGFQKRPSCSRSYFLAAVWTPIRLSALQNRHPFCSRQSQQIVEELASLALCPRVQKLNESPFSPACTLLPYLGARTTGDLCFAPLEYELRSVNSSRRALQNAFQRCHQRESKGGTFKQCGRKCGVFYCSRDCQVRLFHAVVFSLLVEMLLGLCRRIVDRIWTSSQARIWP